MVYGMKRIHWASIFLLGLIIGLGLIIYLEPYFTYPYRSDKFEIIINNQVYPKGSICFYPSDTTLALNINEKTIELELKLKKLCDLDKVDIVFEITNLETYHFTLNDQEYTDVIPAMNPNMIILTLYNEKLGTDHYYYLKGKFSVEDLFYNFYSIDTSFSSRGYNKLDFIYDEHGYITDEGSFAIIEGNVSHERLLHNYLKQVLTLKRYEFSTGRFDFQFNPKDRIRVVLFNVGYTVLTSLIVSMFVIIVFEEPFNRRKKDKDEEKTPQKINQISPHSHLDKKLGQKEFYEKTYSAIWNQYLFLISSRERLEHKFQLLLVIVGIFIAIFFQLKLYENELNLVSVLTYGVIFLIALYNTIPRIVKVPMILKEEFEKYEQEKNIEDAHKQLIKETYESIESINKFIESRKKSLKALIELLLLSAAFPIITFTWGISIVLSHLILISTFLIMVLFYFKFDKPFE
jgi:hypothetical protein